ncbi:MAG: acetyl/propionyl/methylcrotonyl-CoA carboxylase subunit alpha [Gammaproteobacteria bacterium]|nr:acetyl/propionyl/methylcrotonyl-CoA carboxylase subunit alpha [Gammaproteobacteria bacterium]
MFKKILIANRGEIACRVIRTARRMGIATVAVYSDADAGALHARMADERVRIGGAASSDSYLRIDRLLEAVAATGAEAVHPGYGFLSENTEFAEALAERGIAFIGPGAHAITSMGDKITSKRIAAAAGVNTIPGYEDVIEGPDHAVAIARKVGYPVMLKASAGGGGKGMRVVRDDEECRAGFERAANEARSSFGDDRVFAEKFIEQPRHIEIQIIADRHGNVVHLGERECSIQRRHQKVIEESPSPFIDPATRQAMGEQAIALARAVDYASAGTVEFIVDGNRNFYFLEMNTRLQVEHPITEMVTGQDLVELMIRVAVGEPLPLTQDDVRQNGWAVESRVYAEDPSRNFLPAIGRLVRYQPPAESARVRVDTGIEEGSEVSMFYDPMIAKLATWGESREAAIETMGEALDAYYIRGVNHNISFLGAVIAHERFRAGRLTTHFIDEEFPDGFQADALPAGSTDVPVIAAAAVHQTRTARAAEISGQTRRFARAANTDWTVVINKAPHPVRVTAIDNGFTVRLGDADRQVATAWRPGEPLFRARIDGVPVLAQVDVEGTGYRLFHRGAEVSALVLTARGAELVEHMIEQAPPDLSRFLLSPMSGLLVRLRVQAGDKVGAGEELAVVEAMKMENSLRAANDGVVKAVLASAGDSLEVDQPILEFE